MAKTLWIDDLVWAAEGPTPPVDEYRFGRRTFRRQPPAPGQHVESMPYQQGYPTTGTYEANTLFLSPTD